MQPHGLAVAFLLVPLVAACGDDETVVACDDTLRPAVMAHGLLASGDTWANHANRFEANGYCRSHLVAFDWDTLLGRAGAPPLLDALIDATLARTGAAQVDLLGHSAGGGLGYDYLEDPARAAKVARYVHVASGSRDSDDNDIGLPAPALATLNLYSAADAVLTGADIAGATNVDLVDQDHFQVATSAESFDAIYRHLHDGVAPETTALTPTRDTVLSGKALLFGTNDPVPGWVIDVYRVDDATGERVAATPEATFTAAADGAWGPFEAERGARYELMLAAPDADARPVHYYTEPVTTSDALIVLRGLPPADTLVGALLSGLPTTGDGVTVVFSTSRAVVSGRDTLSANTLDLATPELAAADRTSIAFFLYDEDSDGVESGEAGLFGTAFRVFVVAVDAVLPAAERTTITFNGRSLVVPNRSAADGVNVVLLD